MALDGIVVHAIVHELQECVGGRIGKIHQPSENEILLQIRAKGKTRRLLLSANPTYPRVHYTETQMNNPLEPPMFCMLLRKHCENGIIEEVLQKGLERIIVIRIRHRNELGDLCLKELIVEIMGRHSNVILLDPDQGTILDGIHHVTPAISTYRVVLPGSVYKGPPEQGKLDPFTTDRSLFEEKWAQVMNESLTDSNELTEAKTSSKPLPLWKVLLNCFNGISPLMAKEILYRSNHEPGNADPKPPAGLWEAVSEVMEQVKANRYEPGTAVEDSGKLVFSALQLTHLGSSWKPFETVSQCLDHYYGEKAERDEVRQRTSDLLRFLQNEKAKNIKKLEKLEETLEDAKDADRYRIQGELLTASMHLFQKGDTSVEVIDYYDENQRKIVIELDPLLTPSENAQKAFKRYTKIKNSRTVVSEQIESTRAELVYLDSLLQQLHSAGLNDIEEIREELVEQGYLRSRERKKRKGGKAAKPNKPNIASYVSSEGIPIYVGKNNTQNDYVTNRLAHPGDTWLHTKDIPGSHVVIRSSQFGEQTLHEAAMLAAYYSQARESSQVPVDYTLIRHVRKPNGAKPGFVIYDNQKTLFVTPDEGLIQALGEGKFK
ncbi:Rqc2 family fibronectin-binding protein [Paenibacillus senegalensis]|uniref:Rqc2 family fibronectin-binding protein n=1 Tax=Paenibacillus senegalensis TaxID=1465766 RepID=UPI0002896540|nr:NFACT RNA binding domain-containing protein [Paenibacillus senegalensis]